MEVHKMMRELSKFERFINHLDEKGLKQVAIQLFLGEKDQVEKCSEEFDKLYPIGVSD